MYKAWEAFNAHIEGPEGVSLIFLPIGKTYEEKIAIKDQATFEKIALELLTMEISDKSPGTLYLISGSPGHSPDGSPDGSPGQS